MVSGYTRDSSISAAFTTAALAAAISQYPRELSKNPSRGYQYLVDMSSKTLLDTSSKVLLNGISTNRVLSLMGYTSTPPSTKTYVNTIVKYCNKLGLSDSTPNWKALIEKADKNHRSSILSDPSMTESDVILHQGCSGSCKNQVSNSPVPPFCISCVDKH